MPVDRPRRPSWSAFALLALACGAPATVQGHATSAEDDPASPSPAATDEAAVAQPVADAPAADAPVEPTSPVATTAEPATQDAVDTPMTAESPDGNHTQDADEARAAAAADDAARRAKDALAALTAPPDDDGLPDLGPIFEDLERLRGLEFKRDVPAEKQSLEDFAAYVDKSLEEEMPLDERDGIMRGLVRLGLLAEPIDLAGGFRDALLSQAGAYYDPASGKFFYLMTGMPPIFMNTIAAHELVHAQQDQHFDLGALTELVTPADGAPRNDDAILAFRFLVEGDATLTMTVQQMDSLAGMHDLGRIEPVIRMQATMSTEQLVQQSQMASGMLGEDNPMTAAMEAMDEIPPYILQPLMAAYLKGAWFCLQVVKSGDWTTLDGVYADLPASSEQVLHPELYVESPRDEPTPIALPDLAALVDAGWTRLDAAIHGELYLRILLENLGRDAETAERAAAGWDGDAYQAWGSPDGDTLVVMASTWDSPVEAYEFQEAYADALSTKYPGFAPADDDLAVADLRYACGEGLGHGALVLRGQEVFLVEGGPAGLVDALVAELKALEITRVP